MHSPIGCSAVHAGWVQSVFGSAHWLGPVSVRQSTLAGSSQCSVVHAGWIQSVFSSAHWICAHTYVVLIFFRSMSIPVTLYAVIKCPQLLGEDGKKLLQGYLHNVRKFNTELSAW